MNYMMKEKALGPNNIIVDLLREIGEHYLDSNWTLSSLSKEGANPKGMEQRNQNPTSYKTQKIFLTINRSALKLNL